MTDRADKAQAAVDAVRSRALTVTQSRMAALIVEGQVWYRPGTATWFLQSADGPDPTARALRGDGRALRTMRAAGLVTALPNGDPDARGAYPVRLTDEGIERYRDAE